MNKIFKAFKYAFPYTIPILFGFLFLGLSYGFLMNSMGFPAYYPLIMGIIIFAGSMQFVTINLLLLPFDPLSAFLLTLMVNARHLFYGISMLDKYNNIGFKKYYLIYAMCDETFSLNSSIKTKEDVDSSWFMFFVSLLNQFYWVSASFLGGLLGQVIHFNINGIDFVMNALFVVLFVERWLNDTKHDKAISGLIISFVCLLFFGSSNFIIPSMILIIIYFYLRWRKENEC